jgi:hypothetical protein
MTKRSQSLRRTAMKSFRQIAANRRNTAKSNGLKTGQGKERSRRNDGFGVNANDVEATA